MKTILVTHRVQIIEGYNERRDSLDQNWYRFLSDCGCMAVPVPNYPDYAEQFVAVVKPDGIILSGGNDLVSYGGDAPERDAMEKRLLEYAITKNIPLLGVCRGMHFILCYFGGTLQKVEGHVRTRHQLDLYGKKIEVNSFHNLALKEVPANFSPLAVNADGVIEAMAHNHKKIKGIMWHPERESQSTEHDIELIVNVMEAAK
jgi:putative glutamine amidotransferase